MYLHISILKKTARHFRTWLYATLCLELSSGAAHADMILNHLQQGLFLYQVVTPSHYLKASLEPLPNSPEFENLRKGYVLISGMSQSDTASQYRTMRNIKRYLLLLKSPYSQAEEIQDNPSFTHAKNNFEGLQALRNLFDLEIPGLGYETREVLSQWAKKTLEDLETIVLPDNNLQVQLDRNPQIPEKTVIYKLDPQYQTKQQVNLNQRLRTASATGAILQLLGDYFVVKSAFGKEILNGFAAPSSEEDYIGYLKSLSPLEFKEQAIPAVEKRLLALNVRGLRADQFMVLVLGSVTEPDTLELEFSTFDKSDSLNYELARLNILENFEQKGPIFGLNLVQ